MSGTRVDDVKTAEAHRSIHVVGGRQNNLKNVDVTFPKGALTAVTGLSGSGKSSLVFDTLYAEGQRRYVESFSTYARQFLERMDRPDMDRIDGLMPAIALEQKNTIRSARATLASLTELTDFLKLLFAARADLFCPQCGDLVVPDLPDATTQSMLERFAGARAVLTFPFRVGKDTDAEVALAFLAAEGFHRVLASDGKIVAVESLGTGKKLGRLDVVVDRVVLKAKDRARLVEGIELAYRMGEDDATLHVERDGELVAHPISRQRRCCGASYPPPRAGMFSFGSPLGACEECNGFGRVIGVDPHRVVPDERLSIAKGAIKPWRSPKRGGERSALRRGCQEAGIDLNTPWKDLSEAEKRYVFEGAGGRQSWRSGWPGVDAWFDKLQRKIYRMHVRILLASYRSYTPCEVCDGTRFKPLSLHYKLGGRSVADVLAMTVTDAKAWLDGVTTVESTEADAKSLADALAIEPVVAQLAQRLSFLDEVGIGYLTLDRQGRTLSGGEVQRANLTTALGSGLVNTLFVFDEPSVGLHARDADRVAQAIRGLTERDNTVVVVEHDPDVLAFADHVVELGPGPGAAGGQIVFEGTPAGLAESDTATGRALRVRRTKEALESAPLASAPAVVVRGARAQNLKDVTARFPLGCLTVVSGVSGSGKSTLVQQVLHRGVLRLRGEITDAPGACDSIDGLDPIGEVLWVDAAAPGSSSRANPATYMKAWDVFRGQLAKTPLAKERGYAPGTFSFNAGDGRCEACQGAGVERIEMQFLSDVLLTCEVCRGRRFKEEVLEVTWRDASAADLLAMTVDEAVERFADHRVVKRLKPLADAGLGYLTLGQPLATLSGGESQRLKLAHHVAVTKTTGSLFLLDEPTTGQHMADVERLIGNLRALVDAGNTVVVVEHHLDVIASADHVIDLGPDGGDRGGEKVFEGPPSELVTADTETGRHLALWLRKDTTGLSRRPERAAFRRVDGPSAADAVDGVVVVGARVNNLKDVSVTLPRTGRTVVSGVSGSGKSSLAFDLIFAEGQRRFLDCLSPYARQYIAQLGRPDADHVYGIPPTVAIEQRTTRGGRWSTVANVTEIEPFLRLLWARIGDQSWGSERGVPRVLRELSKTKAFKSAKFVEVAAEVVIGRKGEHQDTLRDAIAKGRTAIVDGTRYEPEALRTLKRLKKTQSHDIALVLGRAETSDTTALDVLLSQAAAMGRVQVSFLTAAGKVRETEHHWIRNPSAPRQSLDPRLFSPRTELGRCQACEGTGLLDSDAPDGPRCKTCSGDRLGLMGRSVAVDGATLPEILALAPGELLEWVNEARLSLNSRDLAVADGPMRAVAERAEFLLDVGLGYLTLDRRVPTLSGGESQRIRLAAQLGAHLSGVLYVLDEPTIGLHPADVDVLLDALDRLQSRGNGVLMVEHDERTLRTADVLIDVGPGAGVEGGEILAAGPLAQVLADPKSITGRCLSQPRPRVRPKARPTAKAQFLELHDVRHHNVSVERLRIPRERLTVVTGVSGSGKSTVAIDVLSWVLKPVDGSVDGSNKAVNGPEIGKVTGSKGLERFIHVDDKPIGKNPRSTPATYVGVWDHVRTLFAKLTESKIRGFAKSRFSFNVKGGRCEHCAGQGRIKLEMSFLPDAYTPCGECGGRRFNRQTLRVAWNGHTIADVLELSVRDAAVVFDAVPKIKRPLALLAEVGLGYLQLGQSSTTLSGGEAQRVKLVAELLGRDRSDTVVVLDEPTTGLHMADVPKLVGVFHRLVDAGATVVVIEHNFDVAREADWIIDMGPGAGAAGGSALYQGAYSGLKRVKRSVTAKHLAPS